ncbi:MAPEG family protein [Sinimarinibacterium sp. CAU 1509]|uniref:MAPEG family protein n=1 Tax=Sinimarinibacterium sp. CAU 1509 TaxID=2562283 RepID=UPI0010AB9807|nr:MAPEG family protein [Sinimarinibacterium sp. CAU 1509]TJY59867.1 MAPEG family protein [Sinimarinibacterium sp. CAU 1509]
MNTAEWYAIFCVALFAKMFALSLVQGYYRISRRHFQVPEDAQLFGRAPAAADLPQVQRAQQAWRNDLESIPAFFALGAAYVMVGAPAETAPWLFGIFTLGRVAHSICYLLGLQPWRTLSYMVGIGALIGICVVLVQTAL